MNILFRDFNCVKQIVKTLIKKRSSLISNELRYVPKAGIEPAHPKVLDFESSASTNSATSASEFKTLLNFGWQIYLFFDNSTTNTNFIVKLFSDQAICRTLPHPHETALTKKSHNIQAISIK